MSEFILVVTTVAGLTSYTPGIPSLEACLAAEAMARTDQLIADEMQMRETQLTRAQVAYDKVRTEAPGLKWPVRVMTMRDIGDPKLTGCFKMPERRP